MSAVALREESVAFTPELAQELARVPLFAEMPTEDEALCFGPLTLVHGEAGTVLAREGEMVDSFWVLLSGQIQMLEITPLGHEIVVYVYEPGATFGEVPLLANIPSTHTLRLLRDCRMLRFRESAFWQLMSDCPSLRKSVLRTMAMRMQKMQHSVVQQEKMAALGTMAAGLMHELNNPGAAARRAATLLRDSFFRLNAVSTRLHRRALSGEQMSCMDEMLQEAMKPEHRTLLNSLEQSDAEEQLAEWLEANGATEAWKTAPPLVAAGLTTDDLACVKSSFPNDAFGDTLEWIEVFLSSMQLVSTIEESVGRVTELVKAVKLYAYEGSSKMASIDVNRSVLAALVILGHKMREKSIVLEKHLAPDVPEIQCSCKGLNQIWTNLLDNAIDAVPMGGSIRVNTWAEPASAPQTVCIEVTDSGSGIPAEVQPHIFDPFFTTKAAGKGTGLGLGIANRLVESAGGSIHFTSQPGETRFLVRLPTTQETAACSR